MTLNHCLTCLHLVPHVVVAYDVVSLRAIREQHDWCELGKVEGRCESYEEREEG